MALDSTVGGSASNSYTDEGVASAYFETVINSKSWIDADSPTKESALVTATRLLDLNVDWFGLIATDTQALRWPRTGVYDKDGREYSDASIPTGLIQIVCELALFLIENGGYAASTNQFKSINIGSIGLKYKDENSLAFPAHVLESIDDFGVYTGTISGRQVSCAKLVRA